jgi:type IV secretion system protein VirB11
MTGQHHAEGRLRQQIASSLGPDIEDALMDERTVEIMINSDMSVWIERQFEQPVRQERLAEPGRVLAAINAVASHMGQVATAKQPIIAGILPGTHERFQAEIPPMVPAPSINIRMPPRKVITLEEYVERELISSAGAAYLSKAILEAKNIVVIGGTGTGKTTFANAVTHHPAMKGDRHVIIQDLPELKTVADNHQVLFTRAEEPRITARDCLVVALRKYPKRISVGECRDGGTLLELFKAWNTGHPGGVTTLHANSAEDAFPRIEDLLGEVVQRIPYRSIASAIGAIVEISKDSRGVRRVSRILTDVDYDRGRAEFTYTEVGV